MSAGMGGGAGSGGGRAGELMRRGVLVPDPGRVCVGSDVDLDRIEAGAVLFPGVRLEGAATLVRSGARVGSLGPVLLRDTVVGRDVDLGSGAFENAVFLDGSAFGASGHARAGTLFSEGATAAHAVGTKQTILLPFATLGSNINFCDALLAGGTGPRDHSEVGSGFIHFNFTVAGPEGDKATPSLFGDVVRGIWMRAPRIFLGGAGGVVGPVQVGFGTVLAAGSVYRKDYGPGLLIYAEALPPRQASFDPCLQKRSGHRVRRNLEYLAELCALRAFHALVRRHFAAGIEHQVEDSVLTLLDAAAAERVRQLRRYAEALQVSSAAMRELSGGHEADLQAALAREIPSRTECLALLAAHAPAPAELERWLPAATRGLRWIDWVRQADERTVRAGEAMLAAVRDRYLADPAGAGGILDLLRLHED
jgi:hypothetical protein